MREGVSLAADAGAGAPSDAASSSVVSVTDEDTARRGASRNDFGNGMGNAF